jgi:hypothetical protein
LSFFFFFLAFLLILPCVSLAPSKTVWHRLHNTDAPSFLIHFPILKLLEKCWVSDVVYVQVCQQHS